mgnify:CR=1 FL=1
MKRVLVTGGAGFIGSAVCRYLVGERNISVLNVDKLTYAGVPESLKEIEDSPLYQFKQADVCDKEAISQAFENFQPDAIMHLAAESHVDRSIDGPSAFIETNIRTVFIHFFFPDQLGVSDTEIFALVEKTMDRENPRRWFYALMDYGVMLKQTVGNLSRKSSTYRKQSRFEGSDRQLRGRILDLLLNRTRVDVTTAAIILEQPEDRVRALTGALYSEGLLVEDNGWFKLA